MFEKYKRNVPEKHFVNFEIHPHLISSVLKYYLKTCEDKCFDIILLNLLGSLSQITQPHATEETSVVDN